MSWFHKVIPPKPDDLVEYRPGFACEDGHPQSIQSWPLEQDINAKNGHTEVCRQCGKTSYPAVTRQTWGSHLVEHLFSFEWLCGSWSDSKVEFVHYLDKGDKVILSDDTVAKLRQRAVRTLATVGAEEVSAYQKGLLDGETLTAQFVLDRVTEETANA